MPARHLSVHSTSPDHTCRLAQALAGRLSAGDVILLQGDVGAGKTHFARCLIQAALDTPEDVPSPTYTLVQTYPARPCDIWHADLYRLGDVHEIEELGLTQAFGDAICLVEWPDRLAELAPANALTVHLDADEDDEQSRRIDLHWRASRWDNKLKGLTDV